MTSSPDKLLFTPGPLLTSAAVKQAMLRDLGSRDAEFVAIVRHVRRRLLELGGAGPAGDYEAVLLQGSGTYGLEAVVSSAVPRDGRLLVMVNGAYGARLAQIARVHGIELREDRCAEDLAVEPQRVRELLAQDREITHVALVHCETTTGLVNPLAEVAGVVRAAGRRLLVDAMSSFGAIPIDLQQLGADFVVSSSNKCIEGVPGFSFVLARRSALLETDGRARSLSVDLLAQWRGLEQDGQFRFTPPTHAILAFARALEEFAAEGGVEGRGRRYRENQRALHQGMSKLGFKSYLAEAVQGPIISTFHYLEDAKFSFEKFYGALSDRGFVIYPGKLTRARCFRIGTIGCITMEDIQGLLAAIGQVLAELGVRP